MRHVLIDKRIAGIIRWLERLNQSYSSGAMESALIEAECARADLEILRADVWNRISTKSLKNQEMKIFNRFVNFSKIGFLTALIVLLAVFPISKDPSRPVEIIEEDKANLVLAEPIQIIYEEPEQKSKFANVPESSQKIERKTKKDIQKTQKTSAQSAVKTVEKFEKAEKVEKKVAYEELFSLMQTGQKALKNNKSVVKILN